MAIRFEPKAADATPAEPKKPAIEKPPVGETFPAEPNEAPELPFAKPSKPPSKARRKR